MVAMCTSDSFKDSVDFGDCPVLADGGKEVWIADSAATCHMTPSRDCMYDYEPCSGRSVTVANSQKAPILGFGKILLSTGSGEDKLTVSIKRVAHVPDLDVNLFSLQSVVKDGRNDVVTATRRSLPSNSSSKTLQSDPDESARAVLAPGKMPVDRLQVDINLFRQSHGHLHEGFLRETAKHPGVTLVGKFHECKGCSMAKGLRKPIPTSTTMLAAKPVERVFMDASGPKLVESVGGMKYSFLIRDDFTREIWMYFGKHKSGTTRAFKQYLADLGVQCIPSAVETVRPDGGREFSGSFSDLCRERGIRQQYTPADSPEYNGVAERAIAMVEEAATAARTQAKVLYGVDVPTRMWAESNRWAAGALERSATTANPGKKSPDEMFYGEVPEVKLLPFFKLGYCRYKRTSKCMPKAQECFYLGPGYNYPRDTMRMQTKGRYVITARDVTWQHSPPPKSQQAVPFSVSGEENSQYVESGEDGVESSDSDSDESDLGTGGGIP
ncbi:unnamed protein product [Sphacelaria rigidula]